MRFSSAAIAAPLVLLTSSVFADTCTCPTNQGAVAQAASSFNDGASQPYVYTPPPVVQVPSVPATQKNLNNGAQKALDNMAAQGVIPASLAQPIADAVKAQIAAQAAQQQVVYAAGGTTVTTTVTPQTTVMTTMSAGQQVTVTATQTITSLPPGATILSNKTLVALADIQQTINDAIAAVNLSKTGLDANAQAEVQKCLNAVLTNGGLPAGYSCISQSGSTSAGLQATFNNILEQFLGILPAKLIDDIQDAVMPMLGGLLPDETTLINNVNSAIRSVVSSAAGGSVTAIEMMQSCYNMAIRQNGNTSYLQCYMANGGPFSVLQTAMNGVIEQFVGVLPGNLLASVANLTSSTLQAGAFTGTSSIATNMTSQIDAVLSSVTASLTGNSVTLMEQLQQCANKVLQSGNATAAQDCIVKNAAVTAQTMADSVAQQYSGYLPASFLSDMKQVIDGMNSTGKFTPDQIKAALEKANNNANMGPQFTTCFLQVQSCLTAQIQATGNISAVCSGPIAGCELIGSQNASSPNATLAGILDGTKQNTTVTINTSSSMISSSASSSRSIAQSSSSSSSSSSSASSSSSSSAAPATSSSAAPASSSSAPVVATTTSSAKATTTPPAPTTRSSPAAASSSSSAATTSTTAKVRRGHKRLRMAYADHYNGI